MTITAEQVARAIEAARADEGGISDALGGWQWDKRAPDYVRVAWGKPSLPDFIAALTRWHAELVAAETAKAPDDTAPERLRERREALGWHRARAADGMPLLWHDIERLETGRTDEDAADRARYAAALSAEEARRAVLAKAGYADSPVWDDGPLPATKPERPAPRFKVGDWVRVVTGPNSAGRTAPILVTCITSAGCIQADGATWAADHLEPATPPAPEVVDVPQPLVKRFGGVEASWGPGRLDVITLEEINGDDEPFDVPVAILRAMLEAIDAQQGGA